MKYSRNPNTFCLHCSTAIYRRPSEIRIGRVFCSSKCFGAVNRKERPCVVCGKGILARRNKKTCSRACANKNRAGIRYKVGRPKDKVVAARAIRNRVIQERGPACERCGYSKEPVLHVHHRDRNHSNNALENLELICPNCHYEEHYLEKTGIEGKLSD